MTAWCWSRQRKHNQRVCTHTSALAIILTLLFFVVLVETPHSAVDFGLFDSLLVLSQKSFQRSRDAHLQVDMFACTGMLSDIDHLTV